MSFSTDSWTQSTIRSENNMFTMGIGVDNVSGRYDPTLIFCHIDTGMVCKSVMTHDDAQAIRKAYNGTGMEFVKEYPTDNELIHIRIKVSKDFAAMWMRMPMFDIEEMYSNSSLDKQIKAFVGNAKALEPLWNYLDENPDGNGNSKQKETYNIHKCKESTQAEVD